MRTPACTRRAHKQAKHILTPPSIRHHRGARFERPAAAAPPAPRSAPPPLPLLSATTAVVAVPPARRLRRSVSPSLSPASASPSAPPPPPPASSLAAAVAPKGEAAALPLLPGEFARGGVSFGFDHGGGSRVLWPREGRVRAGGRQKRASW